MNDNDKELLELAAKAARVDCELIGMQDDYDKPVWNPLTDGGEALRLAIKFHLSIYHNPPDEHRGWVVAEWLGREGCDDPVCCIEDDLENIGRFAATRRAIVRVVAEIGRRIK